MAVASGSHPPRDRALDAIERARRNLEEAGVPAYTAVAYLPDGAPVVSPFVVAVPSSARDHARTMRTTPTRTPTSSSSGVSSHAAACR